MQRNTRSGRVYATFTHRLDVEVLTTNIDLRAALEAAILDSDRRAAAREAGLSPEFADDSEWEDELESRPPSPLTDLPMSDDDDPGERAPSPLSDVPMSDVDSTPPHRPSSVPPQASASQSSPTVQGPKRELSVHERRKREHRYQHRRVKRAQDAAKKKHTPYGKKIRSKHNQAHREESPLRSEFNATVAYTSQAGAWVASAGKRTEKPRRLRRDQLIREGALEVLWDGRNPKLILDCDGRIIAILLGRPEEEDEWDEVIARLVELFNRVRRSGEKSRAFRPKDLSHRRGRFAILASGVSFGGGQQRPGNLSQSKKRGRLVQTMLNDDALQRVAGFQSSGLARYAPKLYKYYIDTLSSLFERQPEMRHNFSNSIFPAATFNLGPHTVADEHLDFNNCAHGLCAITSAGPYDHRHGGQLFLKQVNMLIPFPSGSTALIPSAFMEHGNTPIKRNESRFSFTQYAAGGLFRWVKYGFRTAKSLLEMPGGVARVAALDGEPGSRWTWAMGLFSKVDELEADRRSALGDLYV
ncbi:hypothetical protein R3P38DRAFT_3188898 [Favolaschia claudopus]|uniref:Uncharacterized protein n=1 Tax=Favolaschia claudopus TaxID=2862362 RepID=A0AAW0BTJ0_9AGAR